MRRAYAVLAVCHGVVACLMIVLAALFSAPEDGSRPGYSPVGGRWEECTGQFGCPAEPVGLGTVVLATVVILAPSLLVAVPLCAYLARKWQMPALAGFVAAVTGWASLCVAGLIYLAA